MKIRLEPASLYVVKKSAAEAFLPGLNTPIKACLLEASSFSASLEDAHEGGQLQQHVLCVETICRTLNHHGKLMRGLRFLPQASRGRPLGM